MVVTRHSPASVLSFPSFIVFKIAFFISCEDVLNMKRWPCGLQALSPPETILVLLNFCVYYLLKLTI